MKADRPNLLALLLQDFFTNHLPNWARHEPAHDPKLPGRSGVIVALSCLP